MNVLSLGHRLVCRARGEGRVESEGSEEREGWLPQKESSRTHSTAAVSQCAIMLPKDNSFLTRMHDILFWEDRAEYF